MRACLVLALVGCAVPRGGLNGDAATRDASPDSEVDAVVAVDAPIDARMADAPMVDAPIPDARIDDVGGDVGDPDGCAPSLCNTGMPGICAEGTTDCATGTCVPDRTPIPELCGNGVDDDCDGSVTGDCINCRDRYRDGRLYLFCTTAVRGLGARARCSDIGMRLVAVEDSAENDWIVTQIDELDGASGRSWWIGLYDAEEDDDERSDHRWWPDDLSAPEPTFERWSDTEPSQTDEVCVRIWDLPDRLWTDRDCNDGGTRFGYICEPLFPP